MSSRNPQRVGAAMNKLFGSDVVTRGDRLLLHVCIVSGVVTFAWPIFDFLINHVPGAQNPLLVVLIVSGLTFITSFCLLGIKAAGRSAGKRTFLAQFVYTLLRVILYILLPCALITVGLIIWAIVTHQPAFR